MWLCAETMQYYVMDNGVDRPLYKLVTIRSRAGLS